MRVMMLVVMEGAREEDGGVLLGVGVTENKLCKVRKCAVLVDEKSLGLDSFS